jgi:hypothetical protein
MKNTINAIKVLIIIIAINLFWTNIIYAQIQYIMDGQYIVRQAEYDEGNREYTLFLIGTTPPNVKIRDSSLKIEELSNNETNQDNKTYLKVNNGSSILYTSRNFQIIRKHTNMETINKQQTYTIHQPFSDTNNSLEFAPRIHYSPRIMSEKKYTTSSDSTRKSHYGSYAKPRSSKNLGSGRYYKK